MLIEIACYNNIKLNIEIWGCLVLTGYTDHQLQVETYDLFKSYKNIDADNVIYADFGNRTALAA